MSILYDRAVSENPDKHIILTGHSLGGSLAQIVGAIRDVETVTFNAYGTKDISDSEFRRVLKDLI